MNFKPFTLYEFYLEGNSVPQTGVVTNVEGDKILMKIEHGDRHGDLVFVNASDIVDDSFDRYDTADQKLYAWYDGE